MNIKQRDRETDKGWNQLYQRLQQDGLLPETEAAVPGHFRMAGSLAWAAFVAILLIGGVTAFWWKNAPEALPIENRLLANEVGKPTLVATLEDGSTVYLSAESAIEYPVHFAENKREVSLQGDAYFEVAGNRERPFVIHTDKATVEVLGTAFSVRSRGAGSFALSVRNGEVKVTAKEGGKSVHVKPGETALITARQLECVPTTDPDAFRAYLQRIHFKDQSILNIARIMNDRLGGTYLEVAPALDSRLLTITLSDESPEEIARLIARALNLNYSQQEKGVYQILAR